MAPFGAQYEQFDLAVLEDPQGRHILEKSRNVILCGNIGLAFQYDAYLPILHISLACKVYAMNIGPYARHFRQDYLFDSERDSDEFQKPVSPALQNAFESVVIILRVLHIRN